MEFGVLGPVLGIDDGRDLALGGPKQRALLAMLLLEANRVVARERLIEGLWGEHPPPTAEHTLDNYVSRLRSSLGDDRVTRRPPGFVLTVEAGELDLARFDDLAERGRQELRAGSPEAASATLREALEIWRGAALADLLYQPFAAREAERLEERRRAVLEDRIDADLAIGRAAELVPELESLVRDEPFRERPVAQLMLALYRSGRHADALEAFQAFRRRLSEELGLEPGPALGQLQREILAHDPGLQAPPVPGARPAARRTALRRFAIVGAVGLLVAAALLGLGLRPSGDSGSAGDADVSRIVAVPLAGEHNSHFVVPTAPAAVVAAKGSLWAADPDAGDVSRIDLGSLSVVDHVPVGGSPGALAAGGGSVWVSSVPGDHVTRIDQATGSVTQTIPLAGARAGALAYTHGELWIADIVNDSLLAVDPASRTTRLVVRLRFRPTSLAIDGNTIWVAGYETGEVEALDRSTGEPLGTVRVGNGPTSLATGLGAVWVANSLDSTISKIDPETNSVAATVAVGSGPATLAVAGGSVWVANRYSGTLSRVAPAPVAVREVITLHGSPTTLAAANGKVFTGVAPVTRHRGGTLVLLHTTPKSIDPAVNADLLPPAGVGLTTDGLVTYNHTSGPAGIQLVPDLAVSLPTPTDGGTTYTFRLRPGIRYSDGRLLRASDFRRGAERVLQIGSPNRSALDGVRGAAKCDSSGCDLSSGIVTDDVDRTITYHLVEADPDFLSNLTGFGASVPVPPNTQMTDTGFWGISGTGPYKVAGANARCIRYVRNPFFREWSHAAQPDGNPDEIVTRFGLSAVNEVREVEAGRADWLAENIPAALLPGLKRQFPGRLHSFAVPTTDFLQVNTTIPPFDDVRVRRALNFALDRAAVVRLYGGPDLARATCQILAPGVVGYHRYCPYTRSPSADGRWSAPDLARARKLVAASGTRGDRVTVWGFTDGPTSSPAVIRATAGVLRRLGYRATVRLVPNMYFGYVDPATAGIQLIQGSWGDTAFGYFENWFSCGGRSGHGFFCDPRIDRAIDRAQSLKATNPRAAAAAWSALDRRLVDRAAWVPLVDDQGIDFVSARVRNYQSHPYYGILADQLWLR